MSDTNVAAELDWRSYPFALVPGDSQLNFPEAEGTHENFQSDTWYLAGHLTAEKTGRHFAFISIFNRNRPGGDVIADFHTFALFDTDAGTYSTFTDYDMPPKNMEPGARPKLTSAVGHMDIKYESSAGIARWTACRDSAGELIPYTYDFAMVGDGHDGARIELLLHVTPNRAPAPVGASRYNGKITACLQDDTYSYFQTGMTMVGTVNWAEYTEEVVGHNGHIDRQWFPLYAGGGATGGDARAQAHEWHTISLDNGADLGVWRQFDRRIGNALVPFGGITASYEDGSAPECVEDLEVTTTGYARWPDEIRSLTRPPSKPRYMPVRHIVRSKELDLEITGEPLVPVPAHAVPIEYLEGPYRYTGTMRGKPVTGLALYEASIAMYRDWELIEVLRTQVAQTGSGSDELDKALADSSALIARRDTEATLDHLSQRLRPLLAALPESASVELVAILDDLVSAVTNRLS